MVKGLDSRDLLGFETKKIFQNVDLLLFTFYYVLCILPAGVVFL